MNAAGQLSLSACDSRDEDRIVITHQKSRDHLSSVVQNPTAARALELKRHGAYPDPHQGRWECDLIASGAKANLNLILLTFGWADKCAAMLIAMLHMLLNGSSSDSRPR
jgi:hypothetical protein